MSFVTKDWQDAPSTATPLDAAAMVDLETRLSDYTNTSIATTAFGGDATGTPADITIEKIQGHPVSTSAPTTNEALIWNGTDWVPTLIGNAQVGGAVIPTPPGTQPSVPTVGQLFEATANTVYTLPAPSVGAVLTVLVPATTTASAPVTLNTASGDEIYGGVATTGGTSLVLTSPGLVVLEGVSTTAWWVLSNTAKTVVNSFNQRIGAITPAAGDYTANDVGAVAVTGAPLALAIGSGSFTGGNYQFYPVTVTHNIGRVPVLAVGFSAASPVAYGASLTATQATFQFQYWPPGNIPLGDAPTIQEFVSTSTYDYEWICVG